MVKVTREGIRKLVRGKITKPFKKVSKKRGGGRIKLKTGFLKKSLPGRGRPRGSYKYGKPISQVKKLRSLRKAVLGIEKRKQSDRLKRLGYSDEQIAEVNRNQLTSQSLQRSESLAEEEIKLKKALAAGTVSANTQRIIEDIKRIQNKSKSDDISQQRRHQERALVGKNMNLMEAHKNMNQVKLDFTGVNNESNILMARNVFKESQDNPHILKTDRPNVLQTREAGNSIGF